MIQPIYPWYSCTLIFHIPLCWLWMTMTLPSNGYAPKAASSLETVAPPEFPLPAEWLERPRWHPPGIKTLVPCCVESYWILLDKLWKVAGKLLDTLCWDANLLKAGHIETPAMPPHTSCTRPWVAVETPYKNHNSTAASGKHTKNYGKSPFFMGKSTISMVIFNSKLLNYRRVTRNSTTADGQTQPLEAVECYHLGQAKHIHQLPGSAKFPAIPAERSRGTQTIKGKTLRKLEGIRNLMVTSANSQEIH